MNRMDEKGKLFTDHINKVTIEVEIVTIRNLVHGYLHAMPHQRLKDLLNLNGEQFLAVTEASIVQVGESEPRQIGFIAINKDHIIEVTPVHEPGLQDDDYYG